MPLKISPLWLLLTACLAAASCSHRPAASAASKSWMNPVPAGDKRESIGHPQHLQYEVVHSKLSGALYNLEKKPAVGLLQSTAEHLTGRKLQLEPGRQWVLVRACFGHGGNGNYSISVSADGSAILITHLSLGPSTLPTDSALLLQLPKVPKKVFHSLGFAL